MSLGRATSLKIFCDCKVLNLKSYGSILLFVTVVSSVRVTKVPSEIFVLLVANFIFELLQQIYLTILIGVNFVSSPKLISM